MITLSPSSGTSSECLFDMLGTATKVTGPVPVQLALQGGGAKITALMAAVETVQSLQASGELRVTRVAGTSAGAIVACLFAAGVKMATAREELRKLSKRDVDRLFPAFWPPWRHPIRFVWSIIRLAMGRPIWGTSKIEHLLEKLLATTGDAPTTFQDIRVGKNIEVRVVATNLTECRMEEYPESAKIGIAVLNSAGLPYCFRIWTKSGNPVIVDGGICENLPISQLQEEKEKGEIIAFTFKPGKGNSTRNFLEFTAALLDTTIENSVELARRRLPYDNVYRITTEVRTFDFRQAHDVGLEGEYDDIKKKAEKFLRGYIERKKAEIAGVPKENVQVEDPWQDMNVGIMEELGRIYEAQHASAKLRYLECGVVVQANCLIQAAEKLPDVVHYWAEFKTLDKPAYCHAVSGSAPTGKQALVPERTAWKLIDLARGKLVNTFKVPIQMPRIPGVRPLVIFFDPPLEAESGPYRLELRTIVHGFVEDMKVTHTARRAEGFIGKLSIVVLVPEGLPHAVLYAPEGRPLAARELEEIMRTIPMDEEQSQFRPIGWKVENVGPEEFVADIVVNPGLTMVANGGINITRR